MTAEKGSDSVDEDTGGRRVIRVSSFEDPTWGWCDGVLRLL